jgi:hypothetical protein
MSKMNESQSNGDSVLNPFPATAVARLAKGAREFLTIETEALKQIRSQVNDYLVRKDDYGKTICIIGEYGTGKTHLVLEILNMINESDDGHLHPFYLDAPSDNFLELYRKRFLPKLSKAEVLERLDECFSDVVATELEGDEIYSPISKQLKQREIDALDIVRKLGLMESKLQRQFQDRLKHITEDSCFSMALTLFQLSEFEDAIWEWFSGIPPGTVLVERGITKTINTDALALEAIGVLAFLFGHQGHRFILLVDELEKVFSSDGKHFPNSAAMLAFKKLFEAIGKTKALLVLSGLPDFYEALPADAQQRISAVVKPSALAPEDIISYIRKANQKVTGKNIVKPFSTDSAKFIASITGGNARKVVRICYHAFQYSVLNDSQVNRQIIEEVAQEHFGGQLKEDVHSEVLQVLESRGWKFQPDKVFEKEEKEQKASFWLEISEDGEGITISLVQDVFSKEDSDTVIGSTNLLREEDEKGVKVASVLVVGGFVAENLSDQLEQSFDRVITYRFRHFKNDLESVISGLKIKIEERKKENDIEIIKEKLGELDRQYRSLRDIVQDELPKKRDLNSSIQFLYQMFPSQSKGIYASSISKETKLKFYQIFSEFDTIDNILMSPFERLLSEKSPKIPLFELIRMSSKSEEFSIGNFYLLRDFVVLFYDIILRPNKYKSLTRTPINLDIDHICQSFYLKIFSPLLVATEKENFNDFLRYIQEYYYFRNEKINRNRDFVERWEFQIKKLFKRIKDLPHSVSLHQEGCTDKIEEISIPSVFIWEFESEAYQEKLFFSQYADINELFTST